MASKMDEETIAFVKDKIPSSLSISDERPQRDDEDVTSKGVSSDSARKRHEDRKIAQSLLAREKQGDDDGKSGSNNETSGDSARKRYEERKLAMALLAREKSKTKVQETRDDDQKSRKSQRKLSSPRLMKKKGAQQEIADERSRRSERKMSRSSKSLINKDDISSDVVNSPSKRKQAKSLFPSPSTSKGGKECHVKKTQSRPEKKMEGSLKDLVGSTRRGDKNDTVDGSGSLNMNDLEKPDSNLGDKKGGITKSMSSKTSGRSRRVGRNHADPHAKLYASAPAISDNNHEERRMRERTYVKKHEGDKPRRVRSDFAATRGASTSTMGSRRRTRSSGRSSMPSKQKEHAAATRRSRSKDRGSTYQDFQESSRTRPKSKDRTSSSSKRAVGNSALGRSRSRSNSKDRSRSKSAGRRHHQRRRESSSKFSDLVVDETARDSFIQSALEQGTTIKVPSKSRESGGSAMILATPRTPTSHSRRRLSGGSGFSNSPGSGSVGALSTSTRRASRRGSSSRGGGMIALPMTPTGGGHPLTPSKVAELVAEDLHISSRLFLPPDDDE